MFGLTMPMPGANDELRHRFKANVVSQNNAFAPTSRGQAMIRSSAETKGPRKKLAARLAKVSRSNSFRVPASLGGPINMCFGRRQFDNQKLGQSLGTF